MFIWLGQSVSPTDISSIWGVNTPMEVLDGPIPVKDTENNSTLRIVFAMTRDEKSTNNFVDERPLLIIKKLKIEH